MPYSLLADAVLALHFGVVLFVIGGLVVVPVGNRWGWSWVNGWAFRRAHALAIAVIVVQAWLGQHCPLTHLEVWLRRQASSSTPLPTTSFIQHWVARLLYYEAPLWVFGLGYTAFALLVIGVWRRYPPRRRVPR